MMSIAVAIGGLSFGACSATSPSSKPAETAQVEVVDGIEASARTDSTEHPNVAEQAEAPLEPNACRSPSYRAEGPLDAWTEQQLHDCEHWPPMVGGTDRRACSSVAVESEALHSRLDESVLAIDSPTRERIREVFAAGQSQGRNPKSFALIGDSMTFGMMFMGPFSASPSARVELDPWVEAQLVIDAGGTTIIEHYQGAEVEMLGGFSRDSFRAERAAKVGARASWALTPDRTGQTPFDGVIERTNPAVVVLMYGSNDAMAGVRPLDEVRASFQADLEAIVVKLESLGIVPILSTIPRRGPQAGLRTCGPERRASNAWWMAQTNAVSRAAAELACSRRLPLVDFRHALDGLPGAGLHTDGVHPSAHSDGAGVLTDEGLRCGYNVRNYLTLRMLREVHLALR